LIATPAFRSSLLLNRKVIEGCLTLPYSPAPGRSEFPPTIFARFLDASHSYFFLPLSLKNRSTSVEERIFFRSPFTVSRKDGQFPIRNPPVRSMNPVFVSSFPPSPISDEKFFTPQAWMSPQEEGPYLYNALPSFTRPDVHPPHVPLAPNTNLRPPHCEGASFDFFLPVTTVPFQ